MIQANLGGANTNLLAELLAPVFLMTVFLVFLCHLAIVEITAREHNVLQII